MSDDNGSGRVAAAVVVAIMMSWRFGVAVTDGLCECEGAGGRQVRMRFRDVP